MANVDFKLSLPENLRQEAEKAGLLTPKAIESLLRQEIRRRRTDGLFAAADRLATLDVPALTDAEIESEIRKARKPTAA
jgi:post-segregation antitoxin (ccd killing protein)